MSGLAICLSVTQNTQNIIFTISLQGKFDPPKLIWYQIFLLTWTVPLVGGLNDVIHLLLLFQFPFSWVRYSTTAFNSCICVKGSDSALQRIHNCLWILLVFFFLLSYFRLNLPGELIEDGRESASYDVDKGLYNNYWYQQGNKH